MRFALIGTFMLLVTACATDRETPMQDSPPDVSRYGTISVPVSTIEVLDSRHPQKMPSWLRRDLYHDMLSAWAEKRFAPGADEHGMRIEIKHGTLRALPSESRDYELLHGQLEVKLSFYEAGSVWPSKDATIKAEAQVPYATDSDAIMRDRTYNALLQRLLDMIDAEAEQRIFSIVPAQHMPSQLDSRPHLQQNTSPQPLTSF